MKKEIINIIKIGSDSINDRSLIKIINDAKKWREKTGEKFIFVSSGAVKLGKDRVLNAGKKITEFGDSSLASIGQKFLMKKYGDFLGDDNLVGEILIDDYANINHLAHTLEELLINDVWIIVNHNDTLHSAELDNVFDKSDNDKNAVFISKILQNENFIIKRAAFLTNTNGLLDKNNKTVSGGIIKSKKDKNYYMNFVKEDKSKSGIGGMFSKLECSFDILELGIKKSIIANAKNGLEFLEKKLNFTSFYL